jgi:hypothetical protein
MRISTEPNFLPSSDHNGLLPDSFPERIIIFLLFFDFSHHSPSEDIMTRFIIKETYFLVFLKLLSKLL